ncbi:MAG: hypothetical protein ACLFUF_05330 [Opitutales bacterium]
MKRDKPIRFAFGIHPDSYRLPHPSLGLPVILLIRKVLGRAFELMREQNYPIAEAHEDDITRDLRTIIENNLRQTGEIPGFSRRTFDFTVRQGQWENYNGIVLTKTPDLYFRLRRDDSWNPRLISEFDGLFIECKPVDRKHPAGSDYCDLGLQRFIDGNYAWAMPEAMMLGYARHGRTIPTHLVPAMEEEKRRSSLQTKSMPRSIEHKSKCGVPFAHSLHVSQHTRPFNWRENKGRASDISIYHVWFDCDKPKTASSIPTFAKS